MGDKMYKLEKLNYLFQDLEPFIDTKTVAVHYYKHAKRYLDNLNGLLAKNGYDYKYTEEELLFHINEFNEDDRENILFNLGGVLNHNLYFKCLGKNEIKPLGRLLDAINNKYGSYENLLDKINEKALSLKGSGYTSLVCDDAGELNIVNTFNQESPILYGYTPLFTTDLWEHAYYLNYQNDKANYLSNIRSILDFTYAVEVYENIKRPWGLF